jgi:hypothetical protein
MNFSAMADVVRRSGPPSEQVGSHNAKRQGSKEAKPKRAFPNIFLAAFALSHCKPLPSVVVTVGESMSRKEDP